MEPLSGLAAKPMLFHVGKGDLGIPNLNTSQMLVSGALVDHATFYRHDFAYADNSTTLPKDAHAFTSGFRAGQTNVPAIAAIALAAQEQVARFFESDGALVIQPQPVRYFESPMKQPVPDSTYYIP